MSTHIVHTITRAAISTSAPPGMSVLEFVAAMTSYLAWPVLILLSLLMFRPNVARLLRNIAAFEGFGVKLDFGREVAALSAAVDEATPPKSGEEVSVSLPERASHPVQEAVRVEPATTAKSDSLIGGGLGSAEDKVLGAWARIETALRRAAKLYGVNSAAKAVEIVDELAANKALSTSTIQLISDARRLRNAVAHGRVNDLTFMSAQVYAFNSLKIISQIEAESNSSLE